jgi:hypothetical protein
LLHADKLFLVRSVLIYELGALIAQKFALLELVVLLFEPFVHDEDALL